MANLTTEAAVKNVLSTSLTTAQIEAFIGDASVWCNEELDDAGYTAERLELIARYLTCALIRCRDLGLKNVTMGNISENYQADSEVTDYLLRAAGFDKTGRIRAAFLTPKETKTVLFKVGGLYTDESVVE